MAESVEVDLKCEYLELPENDEVLRAFNIISLSSSCTTMRGTLVPLSFSACHNDLYPSKHPWPSIIIWTDALTSSMLQSGRFIFKP